MCASRLLKSKRWIRSPRQKTVIALIWWAPLRGGGWSNTPGWDHWLCFAKRMSLAIHAQPRSPLAQLQDSGYVRRPRHSMKNKATAEVQPPQKSGESKLVLLSKDPSGASCARVVSQLRLARIQH